MEEQAAAVISRGASLQRATLAEAPAFHRRSLEACPKSSSSRIGRTTIAEL